MKIEQTQEVEINITPEQALNILDNAAAKALLSRTDHIAIAQAVMILRAALKGENDGKDG